MILIYSRAVLETNYGASP